MSAVASIQAWRAHETGDPADVLVLETTEKPARAPGEVLVDVRAAGLNFPDLLLCRGEYQERPDPPFTPGLEISGFIEEADGDSGWAIGQRVLAVTTLPDGGLAEKVVVAGQDVFAIPNALGFDEAAAMPIVYQTAYFALHRRASLEAGEWLLVHGGAGGVGSAAIQLGLAGGARVIATATGPEKVAVCRELGAHAVVDLAAGDFVVPVKEATEGRGADVIFDPVGGSVFDRSRKCIAFEGRLVTIGFASGDLPTLPVNHALIKNYALVGLHWGLYRRVRPEPIAEAHVALMRLFEEGAIDPLIGVRAPFEEAREAFAQLAQRRVHGKVVVRRPAGNPPVPE